MLIIIKKPGSRPECKSEKWESLHKGPEEKKPPIQVSKYTVNPQDCREGGVQ